MVKEIYNKNWDFTLYQKGNKIIISVIFFGMVDYHRSFYLLPEEIPNSNYDSLNVLSEKIRNNYDLFKCREVIPAIFSESAD